MDFLNQHSLIETYPLHKNYVSNVTSWQYATCVKDQSQKSLSKISIWPTP